MRENDSMNIVLVSKSYISALTLIWENGLVFVLERLYALESKVHGLKPGL